MTAFKIQLTKVRHAPDLAPCPTCQHACRRQWTASRTALDLGLEGPCVLDVEVGVYVCSTCQRHFRHCPPFLRPRGIYTRRVVECVLASVFDDAMSIARVVERMARDFCLRISESTIRFWLKDHAHQHAQDFESDYLPWVVDNFSGVVCLDEVYQGDVALVLAVDPQGDRLLAFEFIENSGVTTSDIVTLLEELSALGVEPDQVVSDGAGIYPEAVARVWSQAKHQMCLFHQSKLVTAAGLKALASMRHDLPKPIRSSRSLAQGRLPKGRHRDQRIALVHAMRERGDSIRRIARSTGHSRTTVKAWLRRDSEVPVKMPEVSAQLLSSPHISKHRTDEPVEEPTQSQEGDEWEPSTLDACRRGLQQMRYALVGRERSWSQNQQELWEQMCASPLGRQLVEFREWMLGWYSIWWDEHDGRRDKDEARIRFRAWRDAPVARANTHLERLTGAMSDTLFERLSSFLEAPEFKSTSNAAERSARAFRQEQRPHFHWRTLQMSRMSLQRRAVRRMHTATGRGPTARAVSSARGRKPLRRPAHEHVV
jgi:transposase-like protein